MVDGGVVQTTGWYEAAVELLYGRTPATDGSRRYPVVAEAADFTSEIK